ncbi:MAG: hypothetical protein FWG56_01675 [Desulfovibrionaceae bacterium]|nr:hypothetical protein [Desulfovibrionaceae bacterium]
MIEEIKIAPVRLTASIQFEKSEEARRYAELNRQATQAKSRSYAEAVALLQKAKAIKGDLYDDVRLAKLMQQAGQFDEAIREIKWLVSRAAYQIDKNSAHLSKQERAYFLAVHLEKIYEAAALICRRAGDGKKQQTFEQMRAATADRAGRLEPAWKSS